MKGLEFSAVLIPHLHTLCDGAGRVLDEGTISEIRRRAFTAMTRAREILIMSYQSQFPAELSAIEPHMQVEHLQQSRQLCLLSSPFSQGSVRVMPSARLTRGRQPNTSAARVIR